MAHIESGPLTPTALLHLLHDEHALMAQPPLALCLDDYRVLVINAPSCNTDGLTLGWQSWTLSGLPEFHGRIARNAGISLDAGPIDRHLQPGPPTCTGSLLQLIWGTATHAPNLQPSVRIDDTTRFALTHWPDFNALPASINQMRVAAAIADQRMNVTEIVKHTEVPLAEIIAFLNACHWSGWLSTCAEPAPAEAPAERVVVDRTARHSHPWLSGLRTALRLDLVGR